MKKFSGMLCFKNYFSADHGLRSSTSPVLTATGFVSGRGQVLTPQNSHPLTDQQKCVIASNYVGEPYGCVKFSANPPTGGFWANG